MESSSSVRPGLDSRRDDASTLSWPPRASAAVDLTDEDLPGSQVLPPDDAADALYGVEGGTTPAPASRRPSRIVYAVTATLAALAILEGIVIALQLTANGGWQWARASIGEPAPRERVKPAALDATIEAARATLTRTSAAVEASTRAVTTGRESGGQLRVQTDKAGATVLVDGERRGQTPLTVDGLAPGSHRVRLISGDRSVDHIVTIRPEVATSLVVPLGAGSAGAGWIDVITPLVVDIFEEGRLVGTSAQPRLQFPAGEHRFVLINDAVGFRALETVRVKAGGVAEVRPEIPTGLLSINATPWAEVWIDGRPAGTTPLGNLRVPVGAREIRLRHPELGEQTRRVLVTTAEPARLGVDFKP